MAQLQTQIIARRDADGFFLPPERVYEDLPVEENGLTEAENANIEWLAGLDRLQLEHRTFSGLQRTAFVAARQELQGHRQPPSGAGSTPV